MHKSLLTYLTVVFCLFSFCTCGQKTHEEKKPDKSVKIKVRNPQIKAETKKQQEPVRIKIYSFGKTINAKANFLKGELEKVYTNVDVVANPIQLPAAAYNKKRNRYSGRGLLNVLTKLKRGNVAVGITDEMIFHANELSSTFGIFGLSYKGKNVAVISTRIPKGMKRQPDDNLVKLVQHELGHAFGLSHCDNQRCFMVDAEHGNKFAQTPSFCNECRAFLNNKGWKIK